MKFENTFFMSRVGRRIFLRFILCALIPISLFGFVAFFQVTGELERQSQRRVRAAAKSIALNILERLQIVHNEIDSMAIYIRSTGELTTLAESERFIGLAVVEGTSIRHLSGEEFTVPVLENASIRRLTSGNSVMITQPGSPARILFAESLDPDKPESGILFFEANPNYLFGNNYDYLDSPGSTLCVLEGKHRLLFATTNLTTEHLHEIREAVIANEDGLLKWGSGEQVNVAALWTLPLGFEFAAPNWTVVKSENRKEILSPVSNFERLFPLLLVATLLLVALLSTNQIRRQLVPLEKLQEGTRKLATHDFATRVNVQSRDEFEELAGSFNRMADQLGKQFNFLAASGEMHRVILASRETAQIVKDGMRLLPALFPGSKMGLVLLDKKSHLQAHTYWKLDEDAPIVQRVLLTQEQQDQLNSGRDVILSECSETALACLAESATASASEQSWVFPLRAKETLFGALILGCDKDISGEPFDSGRARKAADQLTVAFSNARLMEDLHDLSWGTLSALARAVDAKSPWTAGHSERVVSVACAAAIKLGLSPAEIDLINRGGLLHDIGKIGVPAHILDKVGKLTAAEMAEMRRHTLIGARILEPVSAYKEIIPLVRSHHERFDGNGYPDRLQGDEIRFDVRILSAADAFDAMISDRPYRKGMPVERALEVLRRESNTCFDPEVVAIFPDVIMKIKSSTEKRGKPREYRESLSATDTVSEANEVQERKTGYSSHVTL